MWIPWQRGWNSLRGEWDRGCLQDDSDDDDSDDDDDGDNSDVHTDNR